MVLVTAVTAALWDGREEGQARQVCEAPPAYIPQHSTTQHQPPNPQLTCDTGVPEALDIMAFL